MFTIPDLVANPTAEQTSQSGVDSVDFSILANAGGGLGATGVVSGCAVTADGTDLVLTVAAGSIIPSFGAAQATVAGGTVTATADPTNPRWALVCVNSSGTPTITMGAPAAPISLTSPGPVFPAIPAGQIPLAVAYVAGAATALTAGDVVDKRMPANAADVNLNNHNLLNAKSLLIGSATWPTTSGGPGATTNDGPGVLGSVGTYTISLGASNQFTAGWKMQDQITVNSTGGFESAAVGLRPTMTFSNGQTGQTATLIDSAMIVQGTDTLTSVFTLGTGMFLESNVTSFWALNPSVQIGVAGGAAPTIGTVTWFRPIHNLVNGTVNNVVGIDLTQAFGAGGTVSTWAMKIPAQNSYFAGNTMFGATTAPSFPVDVTGTARITGTVLWGTAIPTSTTGGNALSTTSNPLLVSNGTYTVASGNTYIPWLINDTITLSGTATNPFVYGLGIYPSITASSGTTGLTVQGIACSPTFAGTDTYGSMYGLSLNASLKAPATTAYGVSSALVQTVANTVSTVNVFFGQTVRTAGTWTTLIGLNLTSLNGGTTTWGFQIGNYLNYILGKLALGGSTSPANTLDIQGGSWNSHLNSVAYGSGGTISIDVTQGNVVEMTTATGNATLNLTSGGVKGQELTFIIINDATGARTITFGSNFRAASTLVGTINKAATVTFVSDGTSYFEKARATGL